MLAAAGKDKVQEGGVPISVFSSLDFMPTVLHKL
jgi:hypothetical protein